MARLGLILVILFFAFTVFAFIDCVRTSESNVRALPKIMWAILILVITPFGGILWFALGKDRATRHPAQVGRGPTAPDDDPAFLRRLGEDKEREERIRQLEKRLAELDDDNNNKNKDQ